MKQRFSLKQPGLIPGVLVLLAVLFAHLVVLFPVEALDRRAEAAETQMNQASTDADKADFSKSEMRYLGSDVRELDRLTYEIILRNTGNRWPEYVNLANDLHSIAAMLVSASPELSYNAEGRILNWHGKVGPGEEQRFTVDLITLPGSYGNLIIIPANIDWNGGNHHLQIETNVKLPAEVSRKKFLFVAGGIGFTWLEIMIVSYLLFIPFFLIAVPRLIKQREQKQFEASPTVSRRGRDPGRITYKAMTVALLISLAFMPFFMSMVIDDIRSFAVYQKTTCRILDKNAGGLPGSRGIFALVAVSYNAGGKEIVSAGPLDRGGSTKRGTSSEKKVASFEVGKTYPCWFDPDDPQKFVLKRGYIDWGFYLLFLAPLVLFLIPFQYFRKKLRGPSGRPKGHLPKLSR